MKLNKSFQSQLDFNLFGQFDAMKVEGLEIGWVTKWTSLLEQEQ